MTYLQLAYIHLASIVPAFFIGAYLLINKKGTPLHRTLGKIYMSLILFTAFVTLFMSAEVGPRFLNHFGFIHLLSVLVFTTVFGAIAAIKKGDIQRHKINMVSLYTGGILIAGFFTFMPGRLLHSWLF